ncbi:hypothetical protein BKA70DRAFT_1440405 [Coprinopsis sp. MPI-PUGE-AT-0042]|nr:hypothetical protein BKA70DRAFT_1440405 [Coprinopsis sp. MPI-PUGE-AT-0042]
MSYHDSTILASRLRVLFQNVKDTKQQHIAIAATDDWLSTGVATPLSPYHLTGEVVESLFEVSNLGSILVMLTNCVYTHHADTPVFQKAGILGGRHRGCLILSLVPRRRLTDNGVEFGDPCRIPAA